MAEMTLGQRVGAWFRWLAGASVLIGTIVGILVVLTIVLGVAAYQYYVVSQPGETERESIRTIIAQESPVYYRDGKTRVGAFFDEEHREYTTFDELPQGYVLSIVAAEDDTYWRHWGISLQGFARAMWLNLRAGSIVAGGSTLTQQTAKNLYYRPDRSVRAKLVELLNALRLEHRYSKEEILEFYSNQFHVSGNGRGLGIAARHFFNKEVGNLELEESAFLAGLVKGPANYDPFIGSEARSDRNIERAHDRTRYVLGRLVAEEASHIVRPYDPGSEERRDYEARLSRARELQAEATELLESGFELVFNRGTFRFESSAVVDEIARRLTEPPFDEILENAGIENAENAGLHIITTLDPDAQRESQYALWHHLTEVGAWMEGGSHESYVLDRRGPRFDPNYQPKRHEFRVARVYRREKDENGRQILRLDIGGTAPCIVDRDAVVRASVAVKRGNVERKSALIKSAEIDLFVNSFAAAEDEDQDGSVVLASIRDVEDGIPYCDLERRPELQGAVTVLQDGQIRAMVGGNDNRNFNRVTALRQFGSTWKPLIYHAAMLLGWSPQDVIDNTRNVFPFSTTFYYPRPDHEPADRVSIAWAGVKSENLASVWLLYHLTDRLSGEEVRALAQSLGFARGEDESEEDYRQRIQEAGVLPTPSRVKEAFFLQARQDALLALPDEREDDEVALQSLLYGWNYTAERNRQRKDAEKLRALDNSWRHLTGLMPLCRVQHGDLATALEERRTPSAALVNQLRVLYDSENERIEVACGSAPDDYVVPDATFVASLPGVSRVEGDTDPESAEDPDAGPDDTGLVEDAGDDDGGWLRRRRDGPRKRDIRRAVKRGPQLAELGEVLVDQRLHMSTLELVQEKLDAREAVWELNEEKPDLYDPELLYWHQDFRVLLAMTYVASLAEQYGVQTEVRKVLSMPLGASEITLEEAAAMYTGLVSGTGWEFPGDADGREVEKVPTATLLIQRIEDADRNVLYQAIPTPTSDGQKMEQHRPVGEMTADILRNVVLHGTGRRARTSILADAHPVPVGGKTGTTNDFRNAAFLGFAPRAGRNGYRVEGGYVVGAYVGYDDNRKMRNGGIVLAGASGALPAWIGTIQGLADSGLLGEAPGPMGDEGEAWPLRTGSDLATIFVDPDTGIPTKKEETPATTLVRRTGTEPDREVEFEMLDRPEREAFGTDPSSQRRAAEELELELGGEPPDEPMEAEPDAIPELEDLDVEDGEL